MEPKMQRAPYAAAIIKLLQGPVYADDKNTWREILGWQSAIQEYFGKIGLQLIITEQDGLPGCCSRKQARRKNNLYPA